MKKFLSVFLSIVLVFSFAFASNAKNSCSCGIDPVVYVVGFGDPLYLNPESDSPEPVMPPDRSAVIKALPSLSKAVLGVLTDDSDYFADNVIDAFDTIMGKVACDKNGDSAYNVSISKEYSSYPTEDTHKITHYRLGRYDDESAPYGEFIFRQDWRLSPIENAAKLKNYVDYIKDFTGHDDVKLVCHSQGAAIVVSYLKVYGYDGIDSLVILSPAYQGISIIGSVFTKQINVAGKSAALSQFADGLMGDDFSGRLTRLMLSVLEETGITDSVLNTFQKMLDEQFDRIFAESLRDVLGTCPGLWSFVPDEFYEDAKAATLPDAASYKKLIEKIDNYHYNIQNNVTSILNKAVSKGIKLVIASGYGISTAPVNDLEPTQSDMLIDTKYMSLGAACAPFGKTLGENYKQVNDDGHDHLSDDGLIDASCAAFPEYTWFFKELSHPEFTLSYLEFTDWAILYDGQPTVFTNEKFPQFMENDHNEGLKAPEQAEESKSLFENIITAINNIVDFILDAIERIMMAI